MADGPDRAITAPAGDADRAVTDLQRSARTACSARSGGRCRSVRGPYEGAEAVRGDRQ